MKKFSQMKYALVALVAAVYLMPGAVFAASPTLIKGKVTKLGNAPAIGATVVVACQHAGVSYTRVATTDAGGNYSVIYANSPVQCDPTDEVTVTVFKDDLSGAQTGVVPADRNATINVKITTTQAVPEFGMITGVGALITSAGAFFAMKRRAS